jgi:hypothetical protein
MGRLNRLAQSGEYLTTNNECLLINNVSKMRILGRFNPPLRFLAFTDLKLIQVVNFNLLPSLGEYLTTIVEHF